MVLTSHSKYFITLSNSSFLPLQKSIRLHFSDYSFIVIFSFDINQKSFSIFRDSYEYIGTTRKSGRTSLDLTVLNLLYLQSLFYSEVTYSQFSGSSIQTSLWGALFVYHCGLLELSEFQRNKFGKKKKKKKAVNLEAIKWLPPLFKKEKTKALN